VLTQPAIEIREPADWSALDAAIRRLDEFDWIIFLSSNGVNYFLQRMFALGHDLRRLGSARLAAIGPATVETLAHYHLRAEILPATYRAEALADALIPLVPGKRILVARASRGREVLAEILSKAGAVVAQAVVYESRDVSAAEPEIAESLAAGRIDWITVTSSAIARSLVRLFGDALRKTRLAAISPLTADVLRELGHPPALVAETYTTDGIVAAILAAEGHRP
jgi:uroporphyrinogen III methyltransferase/synthase